MPKHSSYNKNRSTKRRKTGPKSYKQSGRSSLDRELKFHDTSFDVSVPETADTRGGCANVAQGTGQSERIGRKIVVKSIQLTGRLRYTPVNISDTATTAYLYILQDNRCDGGNPVATEVFTGSDMSKAFKNLAFASRFKILKRYAIDLNVPQDNESIYVPGALNYNIDFYTKLDIPMEFTGSTGNVSEMTEHNLVVFAGAKDSDGQVRFFGESRIRYID